MSLDVARIRAQFPILARTVHGNKPLIYLDSAASAQKPVAVIEAGREYYSHMHANVHRGVHALSQQATDAYEEARRIVQHFVNAASEAEIVWTAGATDAINLIAQTWGRLHITAGDVLIVTRMDHHANLVPWQMLAAEKGAELAVVEVTDEGELDAEDFERKLAMPRVKLVAFGHVSNALGTVNDVKRWVDAAHAVGAIAVVDGAQGAPHAEIDVQALGPDFYVFSGHKTYGPTGIGVLYGRAELLAEMPPWRGGGEMIADVNLERGTTFAEVPFKFEAGTPPIAQAIGLGVALKWMEGVGVANIAAHEEMLGAHARKLLKDVPGMRFIGEAEHRAGVVSFVVDGVHPYDLGMLLDGMGIAVRTGQHCTQPLMDRFGVPGTVRASFAAYNTLGEVDALAAGVERAVGMLV